MLDTPSEKNTTLPITKDCPAVIIRCSFYKYSIEMYTILSTMQHKQRFCFKHKAFVGERVLLSSSAAIRACMLKSPTADGID